MRRGASAYERELKDLLQRDPAAVRLYSAALSEEERAALASSRECRFLVIRAAGSLGFDLVALRNEFAFPIEVKASSDSVIRFSAASGRAGDQLRAHRKAVEGVGLFVLYAYRRVGFRSGDRWRLFGAARSPGRGSLGLLHRRLPSIDQTSQGHAVLRWNDGMPLVKFMETVAFLTGRSEGGP